MKVQIPAVPDKDAAEEVILDILAVRGGHFPGKTLLYKTFYLAHLYYWKAHEGVLTHYPIVHMPEGPGLDEGDALLGDLIRAGKVYRTVEPYGPYDQEVYWLAEPRPIDPASPRQEAIGKALAFIGNKSARRVCDEIHELSQSWKRARSGEELPIYLDIYADDELEAIQAAGREADALVRQVFGK